MRVAAGRLAGIVTLAAVAELGTASAQEAVVPGVDVAAAPVRVASYNAWMLPFDLAEDSELRRDRMGPAIAALEPDVVCFQEMWTVDAFEPLADALADRLPHVATGGGGLVVLSRWPLRDTVFEAFPRSTAADFAEWFVRKGFLSTIVETPAGALRVVNSHLTFGRGGDGVDHAIQLSMLVDAMGQQPEIPAILCADLNLRAFEGGAPSAGFSLLTEAGWHDAANAGGTYTPGTDERRPGTRGGWPRQGRSARWDPDYVMFRQGEGATLSVTGFRQALDDADTALSDHNLQLADFTLDPF